MLHIQIRFSPFSSRIKSGLLAVVVFRRGNSKSQTSFAFPFFRTVPHSHRSFYHTISIPIRSYSFAHSTANIIRAQLCLDRYSLFARTLHPVTRCSTVSLCSLQTLHLPSSTKPLTAFHDLVSTICSSIFIIADALRRCKFWDSHMWHSSSWSLNGSLCCCFALYI